MQIDFSQLTEGKVRNLSGHERGLAARKRFSLDALDTLRGDVEVIIPAEIDAIATSFFQGMFADSIHKLKTPEAFLKHYHFRTTPEVFEQIDRGIRRVTMKRGSAFSA